LNRESLERWLAEGLSLEDMGRLTGKHPSTVGYWLKKHALRATHHERNAPKGGVSRPEIQGLVADGLTLREIAERLTVSITTVRYWLQRYGLATDPGLRRWLVAEAIASGSRRVALRCRRHGDVEHQIDPHGRPRCVRCRSEAVVRRRRRVKAILVEEAGGRCRLCGYNRCLAALHFHHLDPATKSFNMSLRGVTRGIALLRTEAAKCVLLCSNCHAEVEVGARELAVSPS
jgi:Homeodomain-like domain-containing protein/helix-turn-helix protein